MMTDKEFALVQKVVCRVCKDHRLLLKKSGLNMDVMDKEEKPLALNLSMEELRAWLLGFEAGRKMA